MTPPRPALLGRDLVVAAVTAAVCGALVAGSSLAEATVPEPPAGTVGFYERMSVVADDGAEVTFIAPQGWTQSTGADDGADTDEGADDTIPERVSFLSPDGAELTVAAEDAATGVAADAVYDEVVCDDGAGCVRIVLDDPDDVDDSALARVRELAGTVAVRT